jgi:hypothetical protein
MLEGRRIGLRTVRESDLDALFNQCRSQDVPLYSLLSTDPRPWRPS